MARYIDLAFGDTKGICIYVLMTFFFQPSGSSKSYSKRGPSQKLNANQKLSIDVVSLDGKPLEPKQHATKFINQCRVIVRDTILIMVQEWNEPKKACLGATFVDKRSKKVKEICPRCNNNIVIIIFLVHDNVYIHARIVLSRNINTCVVYEQHRVPSTPLLD
jgi:hypothetical protein